MLKTVSRTGTRPRAAAAWDQAEGSSCMAVAVRIGALGTSDGGGVVRVVFTCSEPPEPE